MCSNLDQSRPWQIHGCRKYNWGLGQLNWLCWSSWHLIKCAWLRVTLMNVRPQRTPEWTGHMDQGVKESMGCYHHRSQDVNPLWDHLSSFELLSSHRSSGSWIAWERISSLQCKWLKADVICPLSQKTEHPQKSVLFPLRADASTLTLTYHTLS